MNCSIIKTLAYQLQPNPDPRQTYEYLTALVRQQIDPPSSAAATLYLPPTAVVLHSPLRRVVSSLPDNHCTCQTRSGLAEILFDLPTLCDFETWKHQGSAAVRSGFINAFVSDTLLQSRQELIAQIKALLHEIQKLLQNNQDVVAVSHSFRMKLIQAFIETHGQLEFKPTLLSNFIKPDQKTFIFGGYFTTSLNALTWLD